MVEVLHELSLLACIREVYQMLLRISLYVKVHKGSPEAKPSSNMKLQI